MKKKILAFVISSVAVLSMATNVFAHSNTRAIRGTRYEICGYEDCEEYGIHSHDDTYYCASNYYQNTRGRGRGCCR